MSKTLEEISKEFDEKFTCPDEEKLVTSTFTSYELPKEDKRTKWRRICDAFNDLMIEIFN